MWSQGPHRSEDREHHREHSSSFLVRRNGLFSHDKCHWWCEATIRVPKQSTDWLQSLNVFGGPKYNPPKLTGGFLWRSSMMITYSCCRCCLRWGQDPDETRRAPPANAPYCQIWTCSTESDDSYIQIIEVVFFSLVIASLTGTFFVDDEVLHFCSLWGGCSTLATPHWHILGACWWWLGFYVVVHPRR